MDEPYVIHEGQLSMKGRVLFCPTWHRKYVMVRADTRQLAIYNKKVSASSSRKRAECLIIQLKQVVACKADAKGSKTRGFLLQKSANAGEGRKIIFRCRNPEDRQLWINIINDVMNGKIASRCAEFDEIVVASGSLRHYGKTRPRNPGRRLPGRVRGQSDVHSVGGDDADSGVGASSELLATHATLHKCDDMDVIEDDVIQQSPTSQESALPPSSPAKGSQPVSPIKEQPVSPGTGKRQQSPAADGDKKPTKRSSLPRLKKQKKSLDGTATDDGKAAAGKSKKSSSFLSRLGARITRSLSRDGHSSSDAAQVEKRGEEKEEDAMKFEGTTEEPVKEEGEDVKPSGDDGDTMGIKGEYKSARDTNYALSVDTKTKHDKVIMELSAITLNAKLVAQKAEALKQARLKCDDSAETSGEESTGSGSVAGSGSGGAGRSLSRRDSEKNIEQAAHNLRTTLQNLSEAELLELEKSEVEKREEEATAAGKLGDQGDDDRGIDVATVDIDLDGVVASPSLTSSEKTDAVSSPKRGENDNKKETTVAVIEQTDKQSNADNSGVPKEKVEVEQDKVDRKSQEEQEGKENEATMNDEIIDNDETKGKDKDKKEVHETGNDKDGDKESPDNLEGATTKVIVEKEDVQSTITTNGLLAGGDKKE